MYVIYHKKKYIIIQCHNKIENIIQEVMKF